MSCISYFGIVIGFKELDKLKYLTLIFKKDNSCKSLTFLREGNSPHHPLTTE